MTMKSLIKENSEQKKLLKSMSKSMADMAEASNQQIQMNDQLLQTINQLTQTITELKEQLGMNSQNSSKPPSSDIFVKPKSLRKSSGKKPGGQKGHKGNGLTLFATPDKTVVHKPTKCNGCPYENQCKSCNKSAIRNVIDVEIKRTITAHYVVSFECPMEQDNVISGKFPESITSSMQYGDGVKALAISLTTEGMMSYNRTHEVLKAVLGLPVSIGMIAGAVSKFSDKVTDTVEHIRKALLQKPVVNCDETGVRTDSSNFWVHSACDSDYTVLSVQKKRGKEGMDEAGFLLDYKGIIIHDFWKSYWKYTLEHGVCGAHLLRELNGVIDNHNNQKEWAEGFQKLLLDMNATKTKAVEKGQVALSGYYYKKFSNTYDRLMDQAKKLNPEPKKVQGKPGPIKRGKVLCLINRLIKHKGEVCLFIKDFNVPFTNNTAEQSIRMVKVKVKVNGGFRTQKGASEFMMIKSYLGTAKKHGINIYNAIRSALAGESYKLLFEAD